MALTHQGKYAEQLIGFKRKISFNNLLSPRKTPV